MALIITGLENNYYYCNNPIIVTARENNVYDADYFTIKIGSLPALTVTPVKIPLVLNKQIRIDISSHIKALIPQLNQNNNVHQVAITIISYRNGSTITSATINKYFLFGGKRGVQTNVTAITESVLKTTDKIPYWNGYPVVYSYLNTTVTPSKIEQILLNPDGRTDIERRKIKGCNSVYVKFLNSLGGYSYWLFEGVTDQQKNTNSGIINNTQIIDLGNSFEQEIELYSKVPKAYISLMQDLIISPEIYVYRLGESGVIWDRHYSQSNTLEVNPAKNAQSVKIKLKPFQKFNPEVIWQ